MPWTQIQDHFEVTDYNPSRAVRVKKMIWSDDYQEFETHYFLRVNCSSMHQVADTVAWLIEQFGEPRYLGAWWRDPMRDRCVWLADSLATFWQLKYGDLEN